MCGTRRIDVVELYDQLAELVLGVLDRPAISARLAISLVKTWGSAMHIQRLSE